MPNTFSNRLAHAWNAFKDNEKNEVSYSSMELGYGSMIPSGQYYHYVGNEKTIINSIYTRLAMDVAAIDIYEARVDSNGNPTERYESGLSNCLITEANIDQTGRAFLQDIAMSLFTEGHAAIVPTDTTINPATSDSYDIKRMRVGIVKQWYPEYVRVDVYNEKRGQHEEITLPKKMVAIVENPLYSVMNEPNSTLKRLLNKLNLLDIVDQQSSSGKLNMIVQLPYVVKSDARKAQAEQRRTDIETQLTSSKYGIAYTDGTEKIQQLSRPVENNFLQQIEFLTGTLYDQLGLTKEILNGTASEQTMLNYYNHTIEPIAAAIADELTRKFITKTARTQGRRVVYMRDPFKLVPVNNIAEIADKFTRNEILSSNEIRCIIGFQPSDQDGADDLRNKNLYPENTSPNANNQNESDISDSVTSTDNFSNFGIDDYEEMIKASDKYSEEINKLNEKTGGQLKHYGLGQYFGQKGDGSYSTPYYDPVYSHNYYMTHKKNGTGDTDSSSVDNSGDINNSSDSRSSSVYSNPITQQARQQTRQNTIVTNKESKEEQVSRSKNMYTSVLDTQIENLKNSYANSDEITNEQYTAKVGVVKAFNDMYKANLKSSYDDYMKRIKQEYTKMNGK